MGATGKALRRMLSRVSLVVLDRKCLACFWWGVN